LETIISEIVRHGYSPRWDGPNEEGLTGNGQPLFSPSGQVLQFLTDF
jgi:hypothetical protein